MTCFYVFEDHFVCGDIYYVVHDAHPCEMVQNLNDLYVLYTNIPINRQKPFKGL